MNPKGNIQNLKPFRKGQSGNPRGAPKRLDIREAVEKVLSEKKNGKTSLEIIIKALQAKAAKGDIRAAQELFDRGFGKSQQFVDVSSMGESIRPIEITVSSKENAEKYKLIINHVSQLN